MPNPSNEQQVWPSVKRAIQRSQRSISDFGRCETVHLQISKNAWFETALGSNRDNRLCSGAHKWNKLQHTCNLLFPYGQGPCSAAVSSGHAHDRLCFLIASDRNSAATCAFYFTGDLLNDYSPLELMGTISTMETFQRIYRPEIYNANSSAGRCYWPSLTHQDYSLTRTVYDREERSRLAVQQGQFAEESFIKPYWDILQQWSARYTAA